MLSSRRFLLVSILGLCLAGTALAIHDAEGIRLVVLRGTVGGPLTSLEYVADQDSLDRVRYNGVSGEELFEFRRQNLMEMARYYHEAQLAAGVPAAEVKPLYLVLDPAGNWAYAQSDAVFRYRRDGHLHVVRSPVIKLGERRDYTSEAAGTTTETGALNRTVIDQVKALYTRLYPAENGAVTPDVETDVLGRMQLRRGSETFDLVNGAPQLATAEYLGWVEQAVVADLTRRGRDGRQLWNEFAQEHHLSELAAAGNRHSLKERIVSTLYHEMGHLVHYAALGTDGYRGSGYLPHMDGNSHTAQSLSSPEFAFTEGFAEAQAQRFSGSHAADPDANRINYGTTQSFVRKKMNIGAQRVLDRYLTEHGKRSLVDSCQAGVTQACVDVTQAHETFLTSLRTAATTAGLDERAWGEVEQRMTRDEELGQLRQVHPYIEGLQQRQGQLRGRYDFLRSEHAVSNTVSQLMERLDQEGRRDGLLALHKFRDRNAARRTLDTIDNWAQRHLFREDVPENTSSPTSGRRVATLAAGAAAGGLLGKVGSWGLLKLVGNAAIGPVASRAIGIGSIAALAVGGVFLANKIHEWTTGPQANRRVRYSDQPLTLANMLEQYVHDNPEDRGKVYREIAAITEGVLVTREQAAWIEAEEKAGRRHEIDIDQDGIVPGGNPAGSANPTLFPRDPAPIAGNADPLRYGGARSDLWRDSQLIARPTATLIRMDAPPPEVTPTPTPTPTDVTPITPEGPNAEDVRNSSP